MNQDGLLLDRGELEARAAAQQRAAEEAGVMGAADGEAKVNRDAFRAGGGSNGDFDRYDLNQDGLLLDRGELEAMAAAQQISTLLSLHNSLLQAACDSIEDVEDAAHELTQRKVALHKLQHERMRHASQNIACQALSLNSSEHTMPKPLFNAPSRCNICLQHSCSTQLQCLSLQHSQVQCQEVLLLLTLESGQMSQSCCSISGSELHVSVGF